MAQLANTLGTNISRAIADFDAIKDVFENYAIDVKNVPTSEYADKMKQLVSLLDYGGKRRIFSNAFYGFKDIKVIPQLDYSSGTEFTQTFQDTGISKIYVNSSSGLRFPSAFKSCPNLTEVEIDTSSATSMGGMFDNCTALKTIKNLSLISGDSMTFYKLYELENISFKGNIKVSFEMKQSSKLSNQSLINIINALDDRTGQAAYTVTLHADAKARLSTAQKQAISAKNWNLA